MGRIKCGGGDGGDAARSLPGRLEFSPAARPFMRLPSFRGVSEAEPLRHAHLLRPKTDVPSEAIVAIIAPNLGGAYATHVST